MISALAIAEQLPHWKPMANGRRGVQLRCVRVFGRHRVIWERDGRGGLAKSTREALRQAMADKPPHARHVPQQLLLWNLS
jgi:hypothetical protein